jgi:thiosulfate/3-mercaptopyruvate sulfurtransferase
MSYRVVSVGEARGLLRIGNPTVLDMRDEPSFAKGHLPGAERLTERLIGRLMRSGARRHPTLIYCWRGTASADMAQLLVAMGFCDLHELAGGWEAWEREALAQAPESPAPPATPRRGGMTPLMAAASRGDLEAAGALIASGADLQAVNADGNNALWLACFGGNADLVRLLIGHGIDIDRANDNGATALAYCASAGRPGLVALLLEAGADPTPTTLDGFSALDLAADRASLRLLRAATRAPLPNPSRTERPSQ